MGWQKQLIINANIPLIKLNNNLKSNCLTTGEETYSVSSQSSQSYILKALMMSVLVIWYGAILTLVSIQKTATLSAR